jgi:hypothetical protein
MNSPMLFHLPGAAAAEFDWRPLAGSSLRVPHLSTAEVAATWETMAMHRLQWLELSLAERQQRLADLAGKLRDDGVGLDLAVLALSTGLSKAGMQAAWDVTLQPWTASSIDALLKQERWGQDGLCDGGRLPKYLVHVLAGNVLPPTWSLLMRGWLLGAAQWLRPASREPLFAASVLRRVAELEPLLSQMTAVAWWPGATPDAAMDRMGSAVLERADVVTVHGEDSSVEAVAATLQRIGHGVRCVGYGSRWSCVLLGESGLTRETAAAVALDISLFDQQGCLSPTRVFAPPGAKLEEWCQWLAAALSELQERLPRGEPGAWAQTSLRHWLEQMRLRQLEGDVQRLWESQEGTAWSVTLSRSCEAWSSPLDRHVVVSPVRQATELLGVLGGQVESLQGVGVAPKPCEDPYLQAMLDSLRPTLVQPVGELQLAPPSWQQDWQAPLRSLLMNQINGE